MARRRGPLKPMARGRALVSYPLALGCRFIWSVLLLGRERRPRKRFTYYMLIGELGRTSDLVLEPSTGRVADGRWTRCSRVRGPRAAAGEGLRAHEARRQRPPASAASRCRPRTRRRRPGAAPPLPAAARLPPPTNGSRPMPPSCPGCTPGNACEAFGMSCCCQAAGTLHCQSSTKCCCSEGPCGANAVDAITTVEEP